MSTSDKREALQELRRKTDRQLLTLARKRIEQSMNLAVRGDKARAEAFSAEARTLMQLATAGRETAELALQLEEIEALLHAKRAAAGGAGWF